MALVPFSLQVVGTIGDLRLEESARIHWAEVDEGRPPVVKPPPA